jgi:lysophospholipid acyltransferase (LPLAT)-like uncharacterized protein
VPVPVKRSKIEVLSPSKRWVIFAASALVKLLCWTYRYRFLDRSGVLAPDASLAPVVMLMWHNRIFSMPTIFKRFYPFNRRKGLLVLTSASRDGAVLAEFVKNFGMGSVRGSSSRRGGAALIELTRQLNNGFDICITPDGPRGPRYTLGPGALLLAQRCAAPILPFSVEYSACWRFKSWDGFILPKPFSRINVTLEPCIRVRKTETNEAFEQERQRIHEMILSKTVLR